MSDSPTKQIELNNEDWKVRWVEGETGFHRAEVNPSLTKNWSAAVSALGRSDGLSVLLPWCGATKDLPWLLNRPEVAKIVGVELSHLALVRLLDENPELGPMTKTDLGDGLELHVGAGGRLHYFLGDFYSDRLMSEVGGTCDIAWDRGALVANNVHDRVKYCNRLWQMLKPDGHVVLTEVYDFDRNRYPGTPHAITEIEMRDLYEKDYEVQRVESQSDSEHAARLNAPTLTRDVYCCRRRL